MVTTSIDYVFQRLVRLFKRTNHIESRALYQIALPANHLLRRINPVVTRVLADPREKLAPFYSDIGRPSIDPELLLRMLIVGYCYGIRFE